MEIRAFFASQEYSSSRKPPKNHYQLEWLIGLFSINILDKSKNRGNIMKMNDLLSATICAGMLIGSTLLSAKESKVAVAVEQVISKPSPKVQSMIDKYKLEVVDYAYAKKMVAKGNRNATKALLIDARPNDKYLKSTIPSSLNIPDTKFDEYFKQIKDLDRTKEILVYCGGWKCAKSPKVAGLLQEKGFTNVKLYQAGEPEWIKKNYKEVGLIVAKSAQAKNSAFLVDSRPYKMFLRETIPGSISIPDTELEKLIGRFPASKAEKIIVYCGGYKCGKSHKVARKLISMGYKNVSVFAGGLPEWKSASLPTTASAKKATKAPTEEKKTTKFSKNGVMLGSDEGTVDGEWMHALIKEGKVPEFMLIVDVKDPEEFKDGHLKGAVNIYAEELKADALLAKLPKGKSIIFNCSAGGRSIEAWVKLNDAKIDVSEIFYFDANIDCKGTECKIEVNEPLD